MIKVTVVDIIKGECPLGYKVGDVFTFDTKTPPDFCHWAYHVILPFATALRFGGDIPWEEKGVCNVCCPDPERLVVFEIKRVG
ncbi:MAG: TIGR04076 family protein [Candidatus Methanofastidiosia archaeon]|jgi:uncharacterized repeat protein (TIGR04076 family)